MGRPITNDSLTVEPGDVDRSNVDDGAELDVRAVPKPQRHRLIFARFAASAVGESFVLVNSHDPQHLRDEFERDHAGAYGWDYLIAGDSTDSGQRLWRIRITRLAATDTPRVVADTVALLSAPDLLSEGAVWRLEPAQRQLDANVIRLRPHGRIDAHRGPDLDVLLHVVAGSGHVVTALARLPVETGAVVWLPRRSQRAVLAGSQGLTYLSVHQRRPALGITVANTEIAAGGDHAE